MKYIQYKYNALGIQNVSKTIKTVENVAASEMHHIRSQIQSKQQYEQQLERILAKISLFYNAEQHPLCRPNRSGKYAIIVIGGDAGLVGGLHQAIAARFKMVKNRYREHFIIGKRMLCYLSKITETVDARFIEVNTLPEKIGDVSQYFCDRYINNVYKTVDVLYPQFDSFVVQTPVIRQLLPCALSSRWQDIDKTPKGWPIFEPSKKQIFAWLIEEYINLTLFNICRETKLSEAAARTVAMEHAKAQAENQAKKIWRNYIKERHRTITLQQLESFNVHHLL